MAKAKIININDVENRLRSVEVQQQNKIGDICYTLRKELPTGCKWCDGSYLSKDNSPTLYSLLINKKIACLSIEEYEAELEHNGVCASFGLDEDAESFRLPLIKDVYIKAGSQVNANTFEEESLPNLRGEFGPQARGSAYSGVFYPTTGSSGGYSTSATYYNFGFNASLSSSVYKDDAAVETNHINLRAYVVIASAEDLDVDLSESVKSNNPFFFGMYQFFDEVPSNASWLKSDGLFHDSKLYPSFYEWLLSLNTPKEDTHEVGGQWYMNTATRFGIPTSAVSVGKLSKIEIPNPDGADYEKAVRLQQLNEDEKTWGFISEEATLKTSKDKSSLIVSFDDLEITSSRLLRIVEKVDYAPDWSDYSTPSANYWSQNSKDLERELIWSDTTLVVETYPFGSQNVNYQCLGGVKLTYVEERNIVKDSNGDYTDYDYVINKQDETFRLPTKTKISERVVTVKKEPTNEDKTWYVIYSDGWCEQGGMSVQTTSASKFVVTLDISYVSSDYEVLVTPISKSSSGTLIDTMTDKTPNSFTAKMGSDNAYGLNYLAIGYVSDDVVRSFETRLYYYVGDTIKNADVINVNALFGKIETISKRYLIDSYKNGTSWYNLYSDGWVEQGGEIYNAATGIITVSFLIEMNDSSYYVTKQFVNGYYSSSAAASYFSISNIKESSFDTYTYNAAGLNALKWEVKGYASRDAIKSIINS